MRSLIAKPTKLGNVGAGKCERADSNPDQKDLLSQLQLCKRSYIGLSPRFLQGNVNIWKSASPCLDIDES